MSVVAEEELARLHDRRFAGWGSSPIPDRRDDKLAAMVDRFTSPEACAQTAPVLDQPVVDAFVCYAERTASLAVRVRDRKLVRRALVAICIALEGTSDVRDVLVVLPLPLRAAELIGDDLALAIADIATQVPLKHAETLGHILGSVDLTQHVVDMRFAESVDSEGFRFVHDDAHWQSFQTSRSVLDLPVASGTYRVRSVALVVRAAAVCTSPQHKIRQ